MSRPIGLPVKLIAPTAFVNQLPGATGFVSRGVWNAEDFGVESGRRAGCEPPEHPLQFHCLRWTRAIQGAGRPAGRPKGRKIAGIVAVERPEGHPKSDQNQSAEGSLLKIGVIPGDGVGPEVIEASLAILETVARQDGIEYTLARFNLGGERYLATGDVLPQDDLDRLRRCDVILLGAVGHPGVPPGVLEKGILLKLRFDFHQYVNLRPIRLYPGAPTPIRDKGPDDIDMVVVRENNEVLYVGAGGFT
jgi:hypothetical protein